MKTKRKHPKTRALELEHHETRIESLDSKLCKLHIKVLTHGKLPESYMNAYYKLINDNKALDNKESELFEVLTQYVEKFGRPIVNKKNGQAFKWLTTYQRTILLALCEFIDNPLRCHKGALLKLQYCKSKLKGLQFKQRVTLVKVITTLFTATSIESGFVGYYPSNEIEKIYDEAGNELLRGMAHYKIRGRYNQLWNESISATKYADCIKMLKLAGFFEVTACYVSNDEAQLIKQELREKGASLEEIEAVPRVYSEPAYKSFTDAFWNVFKAVINTEHMMKSKAIAVAKRIQRKLSLAYATYSPTSDHFFTRKRKEYLTRTKPRYPQGACMPPREIKASHAIH